MIKSKQGFLAIVEYLAACLTALLWEKDDFRDNTFNSTGIFTKSFLLILTLLKKKSGIDPFLMSVAIGASCAFLTPIGHQCNALILGPGGYRFGDYWKLGLPLEILIVTIGTPTIIYFWPL